MSTNMKRLEEDIEYIEQILKKYLPSVSGPQKTVFDAMEYSLMGGGKRLRPVFMLEVFRLFGGEDTRVVEPFLAAQEMIHTYSLVHDDLPAMDDDAYRRGRKTTHVVYGHAMGILTGDALLNDAFSVALTALDRQVPPERVGRAVRILADKAGSRGMLGGQVVDVERTGQPLDVETLNFIYRLKTSALLESSMMIGAVLAGADDEAVSRIERMAACVGMAFQIQDDILDVTSTEEELGKPIGSDEKNHKTTYVTLFGIDQAKEYVQKYSDEAVEVLESFGGDCVFLRELIYMLVNRRS